MEKKEMYKALGLTTIVTLFLGLLITQFIISNNDAFTRPAKKYDLQSGDSWYEKRKERNLAAMNSSYAESMTLGQSYLHSDYLETAMSHFYTAKSLFPERMGPRKNLCYSYMILCQKDYRYCNMARREIYYAMQHVSDQDPVTKNYIMQLANMVQMDSIIHMNEADAMAMIF